MGILNVPACNVGGGGNTGRPTCYLDIKKIKGVILVHKSKAYTSTDTLTLAAFKAKLLADVLAAGTARIYPIAKFVDVADNSSDATYEEAGYGPKRQTSEGGYDWSFMFWNGGACYNAALRRWNDTTDMKAFLIDYDNKIIGTKNTAGEFTGFTMTFYVPKWKIATGSTSTQYMVRMTCDSPEEINDFGRLSYVDCNVAPNNFIVDESIVGNIDVQLAVVGTVVAGQLTVSVKEACSNINLFDTYAGDMDVAGAWTAVDGSGAAVTITGVTQDTTNKAFILAMTHTGAVTVNLAAPAALAALNVGGGDGVSGYESLGSVTATLPAP